jgi:hypothetical protein
MLNDIAELRTFVCVAAAGGLSAAAPEVGLAVLSGFAPRMPE